MSTQSKKKTKAKEKTILGYVMKNGCVGTWMYLGRTPVEVANCVRAEFDWHEGLVIGEIDEYHIKPRMFSQKELDEMQNFPGW